MLRLALFGDECIGFSDFLGVSLEAVFIYIYIYIYIYIFQIS